MSQIRIISERKSIYTQSQLISKTSMECIVSFIPLVCDSISYFYPSCYHFGFSVLDQVNCFYMSKYSSGELGIGSLCLTDFLSCGKRFLLFPIAKSGASGPKTSYFEKGIKWIEKNISLFSSIAFSPGVLYIGPGRAKRLRSDFYLSTIVNCFVLYKVDVEVYPWFGFFEAIG